MAVTYALVDFRTGGPILDLPVLKGADWATQLNRPDSLSCSVSLRDPAALALDLRAASEPRKTVLLAQNEDDDVLAWGLIDDDRDWDEDKQRVSLKATGVWSSFYGANPVGPATALSASLYGADGLPNTALNTFVSGYSLGTIGKKLVQQLHTWPGSPAITLPADQVGIHYSEYLFPEFKTVGSALTDLTNREGGPDFAFDAYRGSNNLTIEYAMRHGSQATPGIGTDIGVWPIGGPASPISKLRVADDSTDLASAVWLSGGRNSDKILLARALNPALISTDGYPPMSYFDRSRGTVVLQDTLNSYGAAAAKYASAPVVRLSFEVRADTSPKLGAYRVGDYVTLGVRSDHPWLRSDIRIRITSISGNERAAKAKIGCVVV